MFLLFTTYSSEEGNLLNLININKISYIDMYKVENKFGVRITLADQSKTFVEFFDDIYQAEAKIKEIYIRLNGD